MPSYSSLTTKAAAPVYIDVDSMQADKAEPAAVIDLKNNKIIFC